MKKNIYLLFILFGGLIFFSCSFGLQEIFWRKNPVDQRTQEIVLLNNAVSFTNEYRCLLIADPHFGHKNYTVPEKEFFTWLEKELKNTNPPLKVCIFLGDVVDHGTSEEFTRFETFQDKIIKKGLSVYGVVGNHDLYNSGWEKWKTVSLPHHGAFYFETSSFGWYFLDTASGTLGNPQFKDLKQKLQNSSKLKFIFTHYPLYSGVFYFALSNSRERAELISLFARNNVKGYFAGHYHKGGFYDYSNFKEYVFKAFGQESYIYVLTINETKKSYKLDSIKLH